MRRELEKYSEPFESTIALVVLIAIYVIVIMLIAPPAFARWDDLSPVHKAQFLQLTEKQLAFVRSRHDKIGRYCCDDADGFEPNQEDIVWDTESGKYRVKLHGEWTVVPDIAKLDEANIVGRAIVWVMPQFYQSDISPSEWLARNGEPAVRCFLPGPEL